jgi:hypothetical protein
MITPATAIRAALAGGVARCRSVMNPGCPLWWRPRGLLTGAARERRTRLASKASAFPRAASPRSRARPSRVDSLLGRRPRAASSDMPGVFFAWDTTVDRVRSAQTRSSVEVDFEGAYRGEPLPKRSPRLWAGMCGGAVARLAHRLGAIAHPGPPPCYAGRTQALGIRPNRIWRVTRTLVTPQLNARACPEDVTTTGRQLSSDRRSLFSPLWFSAFD